MALEYCDNYSPDDYVYMDPPYVPIKKTSFVGYNKGGFDENCHNDLFEKCGQLKKNGIKFMMNNSNSQVILNTFIKEYTINIISCKRAINAKNPENREYELIIKSY